VSAFRFELERIDRPGKYFSIVIEGEKIWKAAEEARKQARKTARGSKWRIKGWKREVPDGQKAMP